MSVSSEEAYYAHKDDTKLPSHRWEVKEKWGEISPLNLIDLARYYFKWPSENGFSNAPNWSKGWTKTKSRYHI